MGFLKTKGGKEHELKKHNVEGVLEKEKEIEKNMERDVLELKASLEKFKEEVQKQIAEICAALNVLDEDVLELKESKELKKVAESVKLFGRLCLQNKEDIEQLKRAKTIPEKNKNNQKRGFVSP